MGMAIDHQDPALVPHLAARRAARRVHPFTASTPERTQRQ